MENDDLGDISSFAIQPQQKGLLTFYEEQWTLMNTNRINTVENEIYLPSTKRDSKSIEAQLDTQRLQKLNPSFHESYKLPFLMGRNYSKILKNDETSKKILRQVRFTEKSQPINVSMITKIQREKQKQNRIKTIEANIFKKITANGQIKKEKHANSIHIQNYPFNEQQEEEDTQISKLKRQVSGIRIKKGSSFRGFHRQNVSIHANSLNKEILSQIQENSKSQNGIITKMDSNYGKYSNSKHLSRYIFPVISPRKIYVNKNINYLNKIQPQDSLNEICGSIRLKQCRKTLTLASYDNFC